MSSAAQSEGTSLAPSAAPQPNTATGYSLLQSQARESAFLNLEFGTPDRPALVTELLATAAGDLNGSRQSDPEVISSLWQLSVASRLKRLLRIARDTENLAAFPLRLRCPHTDCEQWLEIELACADLDALHDEAADRELLRFPGVETNALTFRRPTGEDLRRWRASAATGSASAQSLFQALLIPASDAPASTALPSAQVLADAFAEFDSLVAFQLATTCPHCGRESTHPVDLETLALTRLQNLQQRLVQENHRLAHAYGWSENDILQVPRARRLRYLAQLEAAT